jgi:hypothetical protein
MIRALRTGKLRNNEIVVFTFERVEKPGFLFLDRAREGKAWGPLVQSQAVLVLHRGEEIGGDDTVVIVADSGIQAQHAARAFAILGRLTAGFDLNRTKCIGRDPHQQEPVSRLGHVKAVEQSQGLVGIGAGYVRLPR